MNLYIKNETNKTIDLAIGINQEVTLKPKENTVIEVKDKDIIYLDRVE